MVTALACDPGSSPHMRGTLARRAYGKLAAVDHPRTCGEHRRQAEPRQGRQGSSPHMRGTPYPDRRGGGALGIIPAHAGNTPRRVASIAVPWDHPRTCGEHCPCAVSASRAKGSSPHMRGTHFEISTIPRFLDSFCLFFIQFYFEYFFARRYLLALLHPRRRAPPKDTSFVLDGRLTSSNPSQSVGDQSAPCTLNARCCSFLAE